jgi:hypothetical protein
MDEREAAKSAAEEAKQKQIDWEQTIRRSQKVIEDRKSSWKRRIRNFSKRFNKKSREEQI